ncbi:MAG: GNAT family N-acetyltransferase [Clostridium sp.]|uniref:GNAT family N-acetyltransferase n=1 Tax=Clostridium sp. TaxID=1506 RepID=UPI002A763383|nr:GNAT family N-acetyltransferase [Clostridium sp.]MDY2632414.1 GNAT family N-acetyltransferase [Clostridium sp.]
MRIETKRLIIRDFRKDDCNDAFEYLSDTSVMKYLEPTFTFSQTKKFILKYGIDEKVIFAVEEKYLGKVIGHIIFHKFNKPLEYELGWVFNLKYHRKGYAKEASLALFEYGFNKLNLESIMAETVSNNKKSIATILSLGMKINDSYKENLPIWIITKNDYKNLKY